MEPTGTERMYLRRYETSVTELRPGVTVEKTTPCAGPQGYHDASIFYRDQPEQRDAKGYVMETPHIDHADPRWPAKCACGYVFKDTDHWQMFGSSLYRRADTGEVLEQRKAPPGAMYDATWLPTKGPDGIALTVALPPDGGDDVWCIDSRCSNCTRPNEQHYCWIRHGDPRTAIVTVDKAGDTCSAGAGSIQSSRWHGFLRDGVLVT